MKRSNACNQHQIAEVHIADGFYDDCDELINRCSKYPTLDYQTFCNIWKDMNLGHLYQGRTSGPEIAELSEEVILIAKHYMLKDTSNFEESVAGLFLVYGLITLQPYPGFAWLRISPEDVLALRRLEVVARRERRLDVLYILGDVLIRRSQYHAAVRERGMEKSYRKYLEGCTSVDRLGVRPKGVFYRQNEELDIMRELGAITRQYVRAKNNVFGNASNPSLNYIDENLPDEMSASLKNIINGLTEEPADNDDDDGDESDTDHYQSVQAIKSRAMVNMVNPMKHLTAVEDRKIETVKTHESDLKTATGKVKRGSPTKPIPGSTTKRKKPKKQPPHKIKRLHFTDFETTEPESILPDINEDNHEVELNLEEFDKDKTLPEENSEDGKLNDDENPEVVSEGAVESYEIEIDSLPVIIRTECQGPSLEIEIFDEYKGDENTDKSTTEMETKPSTSKECDDKGAITKKRIVKKTASLSEKLKKPERRDMKRNKLKAKFNKMGMLPVANFE